MPELVHKSANSFSGHVVVISRIATVGPATSYDSRIGNTLVTIMGFAPLSLGHAVLFEVGFDGGPGRLRRLRENELLSMANKHGNRMRRRGAIMATSEGQERMKNGPPDEARGGPLTILGWTLPGPWWGT